MASNFSGSLMVRMKAKPRTETSGRAAQMRHAAPSSCAPRVITSSTSVMTGGSTSGSTKARLSKCAWAVGRYLDSPWARPISLGQAVALIERVHLAAAQGAGAGLQALAAALPMPISSIALRRCPALPPTIAERIADHRAQLVADSVLYRQALAAAAAGRGWTVYWYEAERVFDDAAMALAVQDIRAFLDAMGKCCGPPWQAKHKLAAAAALAARGRRGT